MNLEQKNLLYKLYSEENVNIVRKKVETASFNIKTRTITMPVFEDMTNSMEDTLGGHESAHAKYTPTDWSFDPAHENSSDHVYVDPKLKSFVNVVEDARIERLMKEDYPGLAKVMIKGYKDFMDRDFFKIKGQDPQKFLLIDKINLRFKLGLTNFNVDFTEEEQSFVDRVAKCTEDEVISLSEEIYNYCQKEQEEKENQEQLENSQELEFDLEDIDDDENDLDFSDEQDNGETDEEDNGETDEEGDEEGDSENDSSNAGENQNDEDTNSSAEDDSSEENSDSTEQSVKTATGWSSGAVQAMTDTNFAESLAESTSDKEIRQSTLPEFDLSPAIIDWKKVKVLKDDYIRAKKTIWANDKTLVKFEKENKSAINYLVKEFEMRKQAASHRRTQLSDTGSIDPNKLHSYKFNDNIFRKIGITPDGKNHGVTMFVDFSGSMNDILKETIEQVITVTHFLRRVGIPFEVYSFTSHASIDRTSEEFNEVVKKSKFEQKENELYFDVHQLSDLALLNLLSSRMTNSQYRQRCDDLLDLGGMSKQWYKLVRRGKVDGNTIPRKWKESVYYHSDEMMRLGGTPLNYTLIGIVKLINDFKLANKIEKHTTLFVTDGWDQPQEYNTELKSPGKDDDWDPYFVRGDYVGYSNRRETSFLKDKVSHKVYKCSELGLIPTLVERLKDRTNTSAFSFFISSNKTYEIQNNFTRHGLDPFKPDAIKKFKAEKSVSTSGYGYDELVILPSNALNIENDSLDDLIDDDASVRKITTAFKKMNKNRLLNRMFLSKLIENVA